MSFGAQNSALPRLTGQPATFGEKCLNSAAVWLVLMLIVALCDVLITRYPTGGRQIEPEGWLWLAIYAVMGLVAIACAHRTGFPAAWDARIPARRRLLLPFGAGLALGLLAAVIEELTQSLHIMEAFLGPANVAFPGSVLVSIAGSVKYELLFLFFPVTLLLWLISSLVLRGRGQRQSFWVLAVVSSAVELSLQGIALLILSAGAIGPGAFAAYAIHSFAFNFSAAASFRHLGLLAPVLVRLGNYLVWHVLYGNFFF